MNLAYYFIISILTLFFITVLLRLEYFKQFLYEKALDLFTWITDFWSDCEESDNPRPFNTAIKFLYSLNFYLIYIFAVCYNQTPLEKIDFFAANVFIIVVWVVWPFFCDFVFFMIRNPKTLNKVKAK